MKKAYLTTMIVALFAVISLSAQNAYAVIIPTIDGTAEASAWAIGNLHTFATDINEVGIPDEYDISSISVISANEGLGTDGLYFMVRTYDTPTLTGGTNSFGAETFVTLSIDFDGNGTADLFLNYNGGSEAGSSLLGIYTSPLLTAGSLIGHGTGAIGADGFEFALPEHFYQDLGYSVSALSGFRVKIDNNGDEPDDSLPGSGFTRSIPEPGTMALVGMGLVSLLTGAGARRRQS